jgi:predicted permease
MARLSELWRRLAVLFRRRHFDRDLEEEMQFHLQMQAEENRANGSSAEESRFAARRQFGNAMQLREASQSVWGWGSLERLVQDVRYACRTMLRSPGLTAAAVLSIALGIGADSAIFSLMDGRWFRPLPVQDPAGLLRVFTGARQNPEDELSYADYADIRKASRTLTGLAASDRRGPSLSVDGITVDTTSEIVSDNYFSVLGIHAMLGRFFSDTSKPEQVLVISYRLWQQRFGGSPSAVGKKVELNDRPYVVIGVAPQSFRGIELWTDIDLWVPMGAWSIPWPDEALDRGFHDFSVVGRLAPHVTLAQARAEASSIAHNLATAYPKTDKDLDVVILSALQYQLLDAGKTGHMLVLVVAVLLLIACANVANLLLTRGEARRRELAIRMAIGCGRPRLVRQLLTESLVLALFGASTGLLLAKWMITAAPALLPGTAEGQFRLDHRVLAFALAATVLTGLLVGLAPALRASRASLAPALTSRTLRGRLRVFSLRDGLVVAQVALSLVLLAGSGVLIRSFVYCLRLDLGFPRTKNVLIAWMVPNLPEQQARVFYQQLLERMRARHGVRQAALVRRVPFWPSEGGMAISVTVPGYQSPRGENEFSIKYTTASENYFRTIGIPLARGRDFDNRYDAGGEPVVIINEAMAQRFWPGQDALGKFMVVGKARREVVGIAKNAKLNGILQAPEPYLYLPFGQSFSEAMSLVVETVGNPLALADLVKSEVRTIPKTPPPEIDTLASLIRNSTREQESMAWLMSALGVLGLLLTAAGLYGVMAFVVTRRTQEIGVRVALGAQKRDVLTLILRRALTLAAVGGAIGIAGALAMSRILAALVFGVSPRDPATIASVCVLLLAVAALASLTPALHATKIDPLEALHYE